MSVLRKNTRKSFRKADDFNAPAGQRFFRSRPVSCQGQLLDKYTIYFSPCQYFSEPCE